MAREHDCVVLRGHVFNAWRLPLEAPESYTPQKAGWGLVLCRISSHRAMQYTRLSGHHLNDHEEVARGYDSDFFPNNTLAFWIPLQDVANREL